MSALAHKVDLGGCSINKIVALTTDTEIQRAPGAGDAGFTAAPPGPSDEFDWTERRLLNRE